MVSKTTSEANTYIKKLEEKIHQLEDVIALLPGSVYWMDKNGLYSGCNNVQAAFLNFASPKEIVGKTNKELIPLDYRAIDKTNKKVMESGQLLITEETATVEGIGIVTYLSHKVPLRDKEGEVIGLLGVSFDITERKQMEKDLQIAKEKAEVANQTKTEFIRNMEHDIRTPLSGIISVTNYLKSKETDSQNKELLNDIEISSNELLDYLNSILEFSHINTGGMPILLKEFNLREVVTSVVVMELPASKFRQIDLLIDYPEKYPDILIGDKFRIHRALLNLASNAIKFTETGHVKIIINVDKNEKNDTMLRIAVEDTGIGITRDHQDSIFDQFTRCDPANRGIYKGTGLGLRIVKQFMDELGGTITLVSQPEEGSTFTLSMPISLTSGR
ncbi:MAG: ATP-binding protein [Gammaproteobacteria bacterium]|nr:ATP-binding protein [Gammaproteobacteria bacterium]